MHRFLVDFRLKHIAVNYKYRHTRAIERPRSLVDDILGISPTTKTSDEYPPVEVLEPFYGCTACPMIALATIARLLERWACRPRVMACVLALKVIHPAPWLYLMSLPLERMDGLYQRIDDNTWIYIKRWSEEVNLYMLQYRSPRPSLAYLTWMCTVLQDTLKIEYPGS
jgi:hypothetical protein